MSKVEKRWWYSEVVKDVMVGEEEASRDSHNDNTLGKNSDRAWEKNSPFTAEYSKTQV